MAQYIFGIDLGGTTVKLGLFRIDGTLPLRLRKREDLLVLYALETHALH